jgi:hypothetical protein
MINLEWTFTGYASTLLSSHKLKLNRLRGCRHKLLWALRHSRHFGKTRRECFGIAVNIYTHIRQKFLSNLSREGFRGFPQSLRENSGISSRIISKFFFPNSLQFIIRQSPHYPTLHITYSESVDEYEVGLISLWLYKENHKLRDWKNVFTYSPLSSTHLWLRCSNFFNLSKKNSFVCAANRKIGNRKRQRLLSTPTHEEDQQMMKTW